MFGGALRISRITRKNRAIQLEQDTGEQTILFRVTLDPEPCVFKKSGGIWEYWEITGSNKYAMVPLLYSLLDRRLSGRALTVSDISNIKEISSKTKIRNTVRSLRKQIKKMGFVGADDFVTNVPKNQSDSGESEYSFVTLDSIIVSRTDSGSRLNWVIGSSKRLTIALFAVFILSIATVYFIRETNKSRYSNHELIPAFKERQQVYIHVSERTNELRSDLPDFFNVRFDPTTPRPSWVISPNDSQSFRFYEDIIAEKALLERRMAAVKNASAPTFYHMDDLVIFFRNAETRQVVYFIGPSDDDRERWAKVPIDNVSIMLWGKEQFGENVDPNHGYVFLPWGRPDSNEWILTKNLNSSQQKMLDDITKNQPRKRQARQELLYDAFEVTTLKEGDDVYLELVNPNSKITQKHKVNKKFRYFVERVDAPVTVQTSESTFEINIGETPAKTDRIWFIHPQKNIRIGYLEKAPNGLWFGFDHPGDHSYRWTKYEDEYSYELRPSDLQ